jgi:hypothetical protein
MISGSHDITWWISLDNCTLEMVRSIHRNRRICHVNGEPTTPWVKCQIWHVEFSLDIEKKSHIFMDNKVYILHYDSKRLRSNDQVSLYMIKNLFGDCKCYAWRYKVSWQPLTIHNEPITITWEMFTMSSDTFIVSIGGFYHICGDFFHIRKMILHVPEFMSREISL